MDDQKTGEALPAWGYYNHVLPCCRLLPGQSRWCSKHIAGKEEGSVDGHNPDISVLSNLCLSMDCHNALPVPPGLDPA